MQRKRKQLIAEEFFRGSVRMEQRKVAPIWINYANRIDPCRQKLRDLSEDFFPDVVGRQDFDGKFWWKFWITFGRTGIFRNSLVAVKSNVRSANGVGVVLCHDA